MTRCIVIGFVAVYFTLATTVRAFEVKDMASKFTVDSRTTYFFRPIDGDVATTNLRLLVDWRNVKLTRGLYLTAEGDARHTTDGATELTFRRAADDQVRQPSFGFDNLRLDVTTDILPNLRRALGVGRLSVGWLEPEWGRTDRIQPTNLLAAYDYTDVTLDDRRVSQLGAQAKWAFSEKRYTVEFDYFPGFTPSRISNRGAWGVRVPAGVTFHRQLPTSVGGSQQVGFRGCYVADFQACFMAMTGRDHMFFARPSANDPTVIEFVYPRLRGYGGDFQYLLPWNLMYRLEGVYRDYDGRVAQDYAEVATSLERIWPGSELYTLVQYVRQVPKVTDATDLHRAFSDAVFGRVGYGDESHGWYGQLEGAVNFDPVAYIIEATVSGPVWVEQLRFRLGLRLIDGNEKNLIGARFKDNDGLFFDLTWRP